MEQSRSVSVFTSNAVLIPGASDATPATIEVNTQTGKVTAVHGGRADRTDEKYKDIPDDLWNDLEDKWILPGLVDSHVHLNDPGRSSWEGFSTGTRAAACGGVTTVIDMPLNSIPPTTTVSNLSEKIQATVGKIWADVGFWGGVIPGNQNDLQPLIESGVKGFKCFLIESGVEEFPHVSEKDVLLAMEQLKDSNSVLQFHAELDNSHEHNTDTESLDQDPTLYSTFLTSRPTSLETSAIDLIIALQRSHPSVRCHIVHLSAASALPSIRHAKSSGAKLTVETCFHYLVLSADNIPDQRTEYKCCPPIRDEKNREELWAALLDGTIDFVVSDHSPCVPELKKLATGDIMSAWGGISSLGLGLSLMWTEGQKRDVGIGKIIEWMSANTASHASLEKLKGAIRVGYDADFAIFDPNATFEVTKNTLAFRNKLSPYEGMTLRGRVLQTFLRGKLIYDISLDNNFSGLEPAGIIV